MATVVEIENALKNLTEDGKFQRICDAILVKKGYTQHTALGSQTGTLKTTSGTPDTYFKTEDGKYVFVEYTTKQDGLIAKITDDIKKCLDVEKTKIPLAEISEIIYYYCSDSTKITPENDSKITKLCKEANIKLTLNGLNQIADELKFKYPSIAKDYLNLNIDTNQILSYDDFIHSNDSNKYSTPLDLTLIARENEITEINQAINDYSISIISGAPGVGKTRLTLECAYNYAMSNNYVLYCIKNKCLPIDNDLLSYFEKPGKYLLFIDDANTWKEQLIKFYHYLEDLNYELKILITVREYAYTIIENITKAYGKFFYKKINSFSKDDLSVFLKLFFNIINEDYVTKIYEISKGNLRLSYMAGKVAIGENGYIELFDATQIYEQYYSKFHDENTFLEDIYIYNTLGLISFMKVISLDTLQKYVDIFPLYNLTVEKFKYSLETIEKFEILDSDNDVIRFSDESFSNYILYLYYLKKRTLSISKCIETFFTKYRNTLLDNLNILTTIFINKESSEYLTNEIKKVWVEFEKSDLYSEFLEYFFEIDLDKTFLYIKKQIDIIPDNISNSFEEVPQKVSYISDNTIKLLTKLNESEQFDKAFLLLLDIYKKNSDLHPQIIYSLTHDWSINRKSFSNGYKRELSIINILLTHSENGILDYLFIQIAKNFLSLVFNSVETTGKNSIRYYTIPMVYNSYSKELRESIWKQLINLSKQEKYIVSIVELLKAYSSGWDEKIDKKILQLDESFVFDLLDQVNYDDINKYQIFNDLIKKYKHYGIKIQSNLKLNSSFEVKLYQIFSEENYELSIEEQRDLQRKKIIDFIKNDESYNLVQVVYTLDKIVELKPQNLWRFNEGICLYINQLDNTDLFVFLKEYLKTKHLELYPSMILKPLLEIFSDTVVYKEINKTNRFDKNNWIYCYFDSLPKNKCNLLNYCRLLYFLSRKNDINIKSCSNRSLLFLTNYLSIDKSVFITVSKLIIKKEKYNSYIAERYFELLFNPYSEISPAELYSYFSNNLALLKRIYFLQKKHDYSIDYKETYIKYFISKDISWCDEYIKFVKEILSGNNVVHFPELAFFWEIDCYMAFFTKLFDICCNEKNGIFLLFPFAAKDLFIDKDSKSIFQERSREWFSIMIENHIQEPEILKLLFNLIIELPENNRLPFYSLFLSKNKSFEDFKKLPLEASHWSWSGSEIPVLVQRKEYLSKLLTLVENDLNLIEHKNYIIGGIASIDQKINQVSKEELIEKLINPQ